MTFKRIAIVSNYDDETYPERFLMVPVMEDTKAQEICNILNSLHPHSRDYYKPVDLDYKLHEYDPNQ